MNTKENIDALSVRELREEELRRLEQEKYRYFEPNGAGEDYIEYVKTGEYFMVFFSAANGVGKSATSLNILAHFMFPGSGNEYFEGGIFDNWPFSEKTGRIVSTAANVKKNIVPGIKNWFPVGRYTSKKGSYDYDSQFTTDTGFSFDIMTYDQAPEQFEGPTLSWVYFDEPPPEPILKACISRLRKGGFIMIAATPLAGSAYLYDMFLSGSTTQNVTMPDGTVIKHERKVAYLTADVEQACKIHGIRGHLEHDAIMNMLAEYSEEDMQARAYGKFQHLIGMVFKMWDKMVHVIKPFMITLKDFTVYEMLDPHPRTNDAALWLAVDRRGTKYVIDELWVKPNGGTEELAQRIKQKASQYRIARRIADPSAFIVDQHAQKSLADRLKGYGLKYEEASKYRTMSDTRIKDAMAFQKVPGGNEYIKAPEIYVFDTCARTIYEIEHYRWQEWTGKSATNKDPNPHPVDKDDHMVENLGRGLFQEPQFVEMEVYKNGDNRVSDNLDPYS